MAPSSVWQCVVRKLPNVIAGALETAHASFVRALCLSASWLICFSSPALLGRSFSRFLLFFHLQLHARSPATLNWRSDRAGTRSVPAPYAELPRCSMRLTEQQSGLRSEAIFLRCPALDTLTSSHRVSSNASRPIARPPSCTGIISSEPDLRSTSPTWLPRRAQTSSRQRAPLRPRETRIRASRRGQQSRRR
jgi:hypothetical protein